MSVPIDVVIPNAVILGRTDATGQLAPGPQSEVAAEQRRTQITAMGRDSFIPIVYGGPWRMGGLLYTGAIYQNRLLLVLVLCEGPVHEIDGIELNDEVLTGGSWSGDARTFSNGVIVKRYLGAQTLPDAAVQAAIAGFDEAMTGTAYLVVQIPQGASQGFPRIAAMVKGLLVHDPRWGPGTRTNYFLNSTEPATQMIATLQPGQYTLSLDGTGYVEISGGSAVMSAGIAMAQAGAPLTITITTAGTVVVTTFYEVFVALAPINLEDGTDILLMENGTDYLIKEV